MKTAVIVIISILIGTLLFSALYTPAVSADVAESAYGKLIRLHIVANSDSEYDQGLKLALRDALLAEYGDEMAGFTNQSEAAEALKDLLPTIKEFSDGFLADAGVKYSSNPVLCRENYPDREYEGAFLPAGEYLSLQVKLGEAEGQNWWCVFFPPMCNEVAKGEKIYSVDKKTFIAAGFTPEEYEIITETKKPEYVIKFKIVEFFKDIIK
jgi:stage II sporulation protein R